MIPREIFFFEMDNAKFIEGVEYGGSTGLRNFVFEEEYVIISTVAIENDQVTMTNIIQDANLENLDTSELPILIMKNSLQFMRKNNNTLNWKCR